MSIIKYFTQRANKVINDPTPACSPSFGILRINNNNPCNTGNTTSKPGEWPGPGQLHLSWSLTLPTGLADVEEKAEKESKENKLPPTPEKTTTIHRGQSALSSSLQWGWWDCSSQSNHQSCRQWCFTIIRELHKMKWKAVMRKRLMWQLYHKEVACQQPISSWLLQHPSF